jgi:hypothetical protein
VFLFALCRRFGLGGSLDRRVNLSLRVPAQMGWCEMEHKWGNEPCIILHQGARSRGYKRCERARVRESERERERGGPTPARLLLSLCRASTRLSCRVFVYSYARMFILLPPFFLGPWTPPFYIHKEMPSCTIGCSWELSWLAGKCPEPYTDDNVAIGGTS